MPAGVPGIGRWPVTSSASPAVVRAVFALSTFMPTRFGTDTTFGRATAITTPTVVPRSTRVPAAGILRQDRALRAVALLACP